MVAMRSLEVRVERRGGSNPSIRTKKISGNGGKVDTAGLKPAAH